MKSVAVLGLFVVVMLSASAYTTYRSALAETNTQQDPAPTCTIYFDPSTVNVAAGETFTVNVLIDDVNNLWGFEIGLKFDHSVMEYVGAKTPHWKFVSGRIEYLFWAAAIEPQNGNVQLMQFTFKAKAPGNSQLSLYVHKLATLKYWEAPKDYVGWPIPHEMASGLVTVS